MNIDMQNAFIAGLASWGVVEEVKGIPVSVSTAAFFPQNTVALAMGETDNKITSTITTEVHS